MFDRKITALATTAVAAALAIVAAGPSEGASTVPITACGQTVTSNAVLTKDLVCAGSNGINVGASGVTIDLKGFTIRGDLSPGHSGVDDAGGYDDVTVKNGVLRNFAIGVFAFNNADQVNLLNLAASGNTAYGVYVAGASATVKSSAASGNGQGGIRIQGNSARIQSFVASGNSASGMLVEGASARIQSSTASGNGSTGIAVVGSPSSISSSVASGNGYRGIFSLGASASVKSSSASGNEDVGIAVSGTSGVVSSSSATGNRSVGIVVVGDEAVITGNRAETNGFNGAVSDLMGVGIYATGYTTAPVGTNLSRGNDDPADCQPSSLC